MIHHQSPPNLPLHHESIRDWLHAAATIPIQWRRRKYLRDCLRASSELRAKLIEKNDSRLTTHIQRLFTHPYFAFEPRPDNPAAGDQQTGFLESQAFTTVALGGTGSGKSYIGSQRAIKFLCEDQRPPIKDTPFFVIADNLEESSKACWAQKLHDLLPREWVDWDRITWRSAKMNFPRIVPLRPWQDDPKTNWAIYFCGYTQDRKAFQAIAAGGAWFTEQFPYDIYEEVVGRMRQWMFNGALWLEFTPLDPTDSVKVQELYEKWTRGELDEDQWSFYRLNTEEAAKKGHVKQEFVDTLKATISPEMLATRLRGDFGSYEGVIYQSLNPLVHFVPGTQYDKCPRDINLTYKRGIDWGAGPSNAFVVLWGAKDSMGRWFIFDEYYTTDQLMTWEDHVREIHKKDGWKLIGQIDRGLTTYRLEPIPGVPQRWIYERSNFGQTYAPPEQPDLFREFAKYCLPVTPARNAFHPGVDCVRRHLKFDDFTLEQRTEPQLFIDRRACPNLARELPALQWKDPPKAGVNPSSAKMEQKKIHDHSCTISSTLVLTESGWKPIIEIQRGEMVASLDGWTRVECGAVKTGVNRPLVRITLDNGAEVVCTPCHRFPTEDGSWIAAEHLLGRRLAKWCDTPPGVGRWRNPSSTAEWCGDDTPTRDSRLLATSSSELVSGLMPFFSIAGSTKILWDQFQREWPSITKTGALPTTTHPTWNFARSGIIHKSMCPTMSTCDKAYASGDRSSQDNFVKSRKMPATPTGVIHAWSALLARIAASRFRQRTCALTESDTALVHAIGRRCEPKSGYANIVARSSWRHPSSQTSFVASGALRVMEVSSCGTADTYCIATESGSMVWGGGVVASNCDALRYLLYSDWMGNTGGIEAFQAPQPHRPQVRLRK